ncbi:MAG: hypothetical protein IKQ88_02645 [Lachnospiraceae bacterium]|nr:hypothetical protein [Lachnospiraceae bacterium]
MEIILRNKTLSVRAAIMFVLAFALLVLWRSFRRRRGLSEKEEEAYKGTSLMWLAKTVPAYKRRLVTYIAIKVLGYAGLFTCLLSSAILLGRPSYTKEVTTGVKRRDIYLCLDVSYSLYALNYDFVDRIEEMVRGLEGDRIGISIFNTSTVQYMPMTDDMEFAVDKLEDLKEYFRLQQEYMKIYGDTEYMDSYEYYDYLSGMSDKEYKDFQDLQEQLKAFEAGTLVNNMTRGSSLVGEGLASCLYNFPSLNDSERTRVILFVSDNAQNEVMSPAIELNEAAALCKKNAVTVFGIFPPKSALRFLLKGQTFENLSADMRAAVEYTGGGFYIADDDFDTSDILNKIKAHEAMQVDEISMTRTMDKPENAMYFLIAGFLLFAFAKGVGA